MIIGNGQLAKAFYSFKDSDTIIFASGVSNSYCVDEGDFIREKNLLLKILNKNKNKTFVYFSSCALSANKYKKNAYYTHKLKMENLIKEYTKEYYIFRIPQLFGDLKEHTTIINLFYNAIKCDESFKLYTGAYRYVIDIDDALLLVEKYLEFHKPGLLVDLANTYKYSVKEIVETLELLIDKQGMYTEYDIIDDYDLNLSEVTKFIEKHQLDIKFEKNYLKNKLKVRIDTV